MLLNIVATRFALTSGRHKAAYKEHIYALLKITFPEISVISHIVYRLTLKSIIIQIPRLSANC